MIIHILRFLSASVLLAYASVCDIVKREVPDKVWLIGIPICVLLDCIDLYLGSFESMFFLTSIGISFLLGFSLCFLGFYGGADGKALLLIAAAIPSYPKANLFVFKVLPVPVLLVFICSTLLSALYPLTIFVLNLVDFLRGKKLLTGIEVESRLKRLILYIIARKVKFGEFIKGNLKYFPAERVMIEEGKIKRKPIYFIHAEANTDILVEKLEEHRELFNNGILVLPTIPMVLFLTVGFVFTNLISL